MAGVEDIKIEGKGLPLELSTAIHGDVRVVRSIDRASTVEFTVSDPDRRIRRREEFQQASSLTVDGLAFRLVQVRKQGQDLGLVFEDEVVWRMRQRRGPVKVFRGKHTRAQFIARLAKQVNRGVEVWAPELARRQPIETERQGRQRNRLAEDREPGFEPGVQLTVKGSRATRTQIAMGARALAVARSLDAHRRAQVALVAGCIVESGMGTSGMSTAVDHDSIGILQVRVGIHGRDVAESVERSCTVFLRKGFAGSGGAIQLARTTNLSPGEIAVKVLAPNSAFAHRYTDAEAEAAEWVDAYNGGAGPAQITVTRRYPFRVARNETFWEAARRLTDEVNWRLFSDGQTLYVAHDLTLLEGRPKMSLSEDSPGVDFVDWEWDSNKVNEARLVGRADAWFAGIGSVVTLPAEEGPASGRWLVSEIKTFLNREDVEVSLKRPERPLPEPAPERVTRTVTPATGSGSADKMIRWAKATLGTREGSRNHVKWATEFGRPLSDPWCSIWIAYGLVKICGLPLPEGPAYSGTWLEWEGGRRVAKSDIRPGDVLVYDWGDGGITDHVALAISSTRSIGGNEQDQVLESPIKHSSIVGVVRPYYTRSAREKRQAVEQAAEDTRSRATVGRGGSGWPT